MNTELFESLKPNLAEHIMTWMNEHCPLSKDETMEVNILVTARPQIKINLGMSEEEQVIAGELLCRKLEELNWTGRGHDELCKKLITVGQLIRLSVSDLYSRFKGIGPGTVDIIRMNLQVYSLKLGSTSKPSEEEISVIRTTPTEEFFQYPLSYFEFQIKFPTLGILKDAGNKSIEEYISTKMSESDINTNPFFKGRTSADILSEVLRECSFIFETLGEV